MRHTYVIEFDRSRYADLHSMIEWCGRNFGEGGHPSLGDTWLLETAFGNSRFSFKYSKDATLFAMIWT